MIRRGAAWAVLAATSACGRLAFDPIGDGGTVVSACTSMNASSPVRLATVDPAEAIAATPTASGIVVGWGASGSILTGEVAPTGGAFRAMQPIGSGYNAALASGDGIVALTFAALPAEPTPHEFMPLTLTGATMNLLVAEYSNSAEGFGNAAVWEGTRWLLSYTRNSGEFGAFTTRFSSGGVQLDGPRKVSNVGDCLCEPRLAWNGTSAGVVFDNDGLGAGGYDIGFNTYDASGAVVYPDAKAISTTGGTEPTIGATTDGFVIGYSDDNGEGEVVWVDNLGAMVVDPTHIHPAARIHALEETAAGTFVLFEDRTSFSMTSFSIGWLARGGGYTRGPFVVTNEPDIGRRAVAIPRGNGAVVFYTSGIDGTDALWTRTFTCVD